MTQQGQEKTSVPKFGDWESSENTAFTYYFEKARKVREEEGSPNNLSIKKAASAIRITAEGIQSAAVENSPLNSHHNQLKGSPVQQRRCHHGASKMRLMDHNDEIEGKESKVPIFGAWDESDPSTADGFTEKFDEVREENKHAEKDVIIKRKADPHFAIVYTEPEKNKKTSKVKKSLGKFFSCLGG